MAIDREGNCRGGNFPGGYCHEGAKVRGAIVWGAIVFGGVCPGRFDLCYPIDKLLLGTKLVQAETRGRTRFG